jgi:hypothetical protein
MELGGFGDGWFIGAAGYNEHVFTRSIKRLTKTCSRKFQPVKFSLFLNSESKFLLTSSATLLAGIRSTTLENEMLFISAPTKPPRYN